MDTSLIVAIIGAAGGIIGIVIQQGGSTRDRIDALRRDLSFQVDGVRAETGRVGKELALLTTRVDSIPRSPVAEADCRERHDQIEERVADLRSGLAAIQPRRLVITGSGGEH